MQRVPPVVSILDFHEKNKGSISKIFLWILIKDYLETPNLLFF